MRGERRRDWWAILVTIVEPARLERKESIRAAARHAGMSEATWRQLTSGRHPSPGTGHRWPTRDQLLDMATAVGTRCRVAKLIHATSDELARSEERLSMIPDDAEYELLTARHLTPTEKLTLIDVLREMRRPNPPNNGDTPEGIAS